MSIEKYQILRYAFKTCDVNKEVIQHGNKCQKIKSTCVGEWSLQNVKDIVK